MPSDDSFGWDEIAIMVARLTHPHPHPCRLCNISMIFESFRLLQSHSYLMRPLSKVETRRSLLDSQPPSPL